MRNGKRCRNAKIAHAKGHQDESGKIIGKGDYMSAFETQRVFRVWYEIIHEEVEKLDSLRRDHNHRDKHEATVISNNHSRVVSTVYKDISSNVVKVSHFKNNLTCLYCLSRMPESLLPCGHTLCKPCTRALGKDKGQGKIELISCPLHFRKDSGGETWTNPFLMQSKPREAGVRVLCLDGSVNPLAFAPSMIQQTDLCHSGGVRGLVELAVLKAIETELGGYIPIQKFFDLMVGTR